MAILKSSRMAAPMSVGDLRTQVMPSLRKMRNDLCVQIDGPTTQFGVPLRYSLVLSQNESIALALKVADVFAPPAVIRSPSRVNRLEDLVEWLETRDEWR